MMKLFRKRRKNYTSKGESDLEVARIAEEKLKWRNIHERKPQNGKHMNDIQKQEDASKMAEAALGKETQD